MSGAFFFTDFPRKYTEFYRKHRLLQNTSEILMPFEEAVHFTLSAMANIVGDILYNSGLEGFVMA